MFDMELSSVINLHLHILQSDTTNSNRVWVWIYRRVRDQEWNGWQIKIHFSSSSILHISLCIVKENITPSFIPLDAPGLLRQSKTKYAGKEIIRILYLFACSHHFATEIRHSTELGFMLCHCRTRTSCTHFGPEGSFLYIHMKDQPHLH